jgi:hypothetical protein
MTFADLPIGAHYRIVSAIDPTVVLPSVRIKVSESHYRMLHPSHGIKRVTPASTVVVPVSAKERYQL